ncbi:hypothetical protein [Desulfosudis oleivorans]|uniref:Uncharacterized protein n=1 Tax=Desulfosudis oleivorans (strain DSM 6200 / JCM 39069 / Hxd3) TaxID=96561 RepID=A8ZY36_DESOH|nr:hypothetical protein [Desulfosudis oleivorans]ABW67043.1 hypothetical protein Dole_1237 [Desulfosudis oleivorans Hxd3]
MMDRRLSTQYGYGAARILLPAPVRYRVPLHSRWYLHPSFVGLVGALVILSLLRSCVTPVIKPGRTILWLQPPPEAVVPRTEAPAVAMPRAAKAPAVPEKKPERVVLETPRPIEEALPPPEMSLERQKTRRERTVYEKPDTAVMLENRTSRPDIARRSHTVERPDTYAAQTMPDISVPDAAYRLDRQPDSRPPDPDRDLRQMAPPSAFTPLPAEDSMPSLARSTAGNRSKTVTLMSGPAIPGGEIVGGGVGHELERAPGSGGNSRLASPVARPSGVTVAVPDTGIGPTFPAKEETAPEDMVTIAGTIEGESTRIATLKQDIFRKVQSTEFKAGSYCCTVDGVKCRIVITKEKRVRLSFSTESIPFKVVSRLERLLPEGVKPCAD